MGIQVIESTGTDIPSRRMHRDPHTQRVFGVSAARTPRTHSRLQSVLTSANPGVQTGLTPRRDRPPTPTWCEM